MFSLRYILFNLSGFQWFWWGKAGFLTVLTLVLFLLNRPMLSHKNGKDTHFLCFHRIFFFYMFYGFPPLISNDIGLYFIYNILFAFNIYAKIFILVVEWMWKSDNEFGLKKQASVHVTCVWMFNFKSRQEQYSFAVHVIHRIKDKTVPNLTRNLE